jgi:hypothetical protein
MHYRLRTLMIVLALGPPLLAVAWTNGDALQGDIEKVIPAGLRPESEARIRNQLKSNQTAHAFARAGAFIFYILTVYLLGSDLNNWRKGFSDYRNWTPPEGQWATVIASVLATISILIFFLTIPARPIIQRTDFASQRAYDNWLGDHTLENIKRRNDEAWERLSKAFEQWERKRNGAASTVPPKPEWPSTDSNP